MSLNNLAAVVAVIKSRMLRWFGLTTCRAEKKLVSSKDPWKKNPKEKTVCDATKKMGRSNGELVEGFLDLAKNRGQWKTTVHEAKNRLLF